MPPTFLDYKIMVAHEFIVKNDENMFKYNLRFHKKHSETIILPTPSLFDLTYFRACTSFCRRPFMHTGA